jgi:hypothetical protein
VLPRWISYFGKQQNGVYKVADLEDVLVSFGGVVYSSNDKKLTWWARPGMRLPTSNGSARAVDPEFGRLIHQWEALHVVTYDFDPIYQVGFFLQNRVWIYSDRYDDSRVRHWFAPYVSYAVTPKFKTQLYFEGMWENNRRKPSINDRSPSYRNVWQSMMIATPWDITPSFNVMPLVSAYLNTNPFTADAFYLGAWVTYVFK